MYMIHMYMYVHIYLARLVKAVSEAQGYYGAYECFDLFAAETVLLLAYLAIRLYKRITQVWNTAHTGSKPELLGLVQAHL